MRPRYIILIIFPLIITFLGCSKRMMVRKFYFLSSPEITQKSDNAAQSHLPYRCLLLPTSVLSAYDIPKIALRTNSHEIEYFLYHQWTSTPSHMFTEIIQKFFQKQRLFREIDLHIEKQDVAFQMESDVISIEIIRRENIWLAHLQMYLALKTYPDEKILISHEFDRTTPLLKRNINLFVDALQKILEEELTLFYEKIKEELIRPQK